MPVSLPVLASQIIANRSPPIPLIVGSTRPITALVAMAASTADPPRARICAPACDASVCSAPTIPRCVMVIERACERSWAKDGAGKEMAIPANVARKILRDTINKQDTGDGNPLCCSNGHNVAPELLLSFAGRVYLRKFISFLLLAVLMLFIAV